MDGQGRKDRRSLRNRYLTEDPEEIAFAVTPPVRKLGIVCRAGAQNPGGASKLRKVTHTKTYTPPPTREGPPALRHWRAFAYDSPGDRI